MKSKIHASKRLFHPIALLAALMLSLPGTVQAQKQGLVSMHMEPVIVEAVPFQDLTTALKKHTRLEVSPDIEEATPVQFFYAIAKGGEIAGPFASTRVVAREGKLLPKRGRAIVSPWDAFDDPLVGFVDPLLGFDDPLLGFGDPRAVVINHEEQIPTPERLLKAVWGNGNVGLEKDEYALVLFSMNAEGERTPVQHTAMVVPFRVTEGQTRKQRP